MTQELQPALPYSLREDRTAVLTVLVSNLLMITLFDDKRKHFAVVNLEQELLTLFDSIIIWINERSKSIPDNVELRALRC